MKKFIEGFVVSLLVILLILGLVTCVLALPLFLVHHTGNPKWLLLIVIICSIMTGIINAVMGD
jgi:NhaP-type Na+/H+ or K+/H+ antiporter